MILIKLLLILMISGTGKSEGFSYNIFEGEKFGAFEYKRLEKR